MNCQIQNCKEKSTHTRIETMNLDDEYITIHTNLCNLHTVIIEHTPDSNWSIVKS